MAKTKQDIKLLPKTDFHEVDPYTEAEIQQALATLPRTSYYYGVKAKEALKTWNQAKQQAKITRAQVWLESIKKKATKELTSEGDRKAWVEADDRVVAADVREIVAQAEYEHANLLVKQADDTFVAVRKAANLIEKETEAVRREAKYGGSTSEN